MKRILSKVKDGIKGVFNRKLRKTHAVVTKAEKPDKQKALKENLPAEVSISESKFYTTQPKPEPTKSASPAPSQLPSGYAQDRIVLQVRDPWWIHAYWEIAESTWERLNKEFSTYFAGSFNKVLRVYDISHIVFTGDNAHRFFDIEVSKEANNWYIDTQGPGRSWCVDFGIRLSNGKFITILRSNTVSTPLSGPSWITDEEWMIPEDLFRRLYGMGVGLGSSPLKSKKLWEARLQREVSSGGVSSLASPVKKKVRPEEFWLSVNTELIIYGQTQPEAKLTVGGQPVALRSDGSFSLRFFLPDGKQVIPVVAASSDGKQVKKITPIVTKETNK
jgi:hypothetical protein